MGQKTPTCSNDVQATVPGLHPKFKMGVAGKSLEPSCNKCK